MSRVFCFLMAFTELGFYFILGLGLRLRLVRVLYTPWVLLFFLVLSLVFVFNSFYLIIYLVRDGKGSGIGEETLKNKVLLEVVHN